MGQLKDDVNNESIIPLNADVNYNTEAYDDPTNQGMDDDKLMAN